MNEPNDNIIDEAFDNLDSVEPEEVVDDTGTETTAEETVPETSELPPEEGASDNADVSDAVYTVKVDGEEKEVPLEELIRGYAHKSAANKRFQEAADLRKEFESTQGEYRQFIDSLTESPLQTLAQIPQLKERLQEDLKGYLAEVIQREQMSEEELRAHDLQEEIARKEAYFEELEAKKQRTEQEYQTNKFKQELSGWVSEEAKEFGAGEQRDLFRLNLEATAARLHGQGQLITQEHIQEVAQKTKELLGKFGGAKAAKPAATPPAPGGKTLTSKELLGKNKRELKRADNFFSNLSDKYGLLY